MPGRASCWRIGFVFLSPFYFSLLAQAQTYTPPTPIENYMPLDGMLNITVTAGPISTLNTSLPEITPLVFTQGSGESLTRVYLLPTAWTRACPSSVNILDTDKTPASLVNPSCQLVSKPGILKQLDVNDWPVFFDPDVPGVDRNWKNAPWQKTYNGIFGIHPIPGTNKYVAIRHNEHANRMDVDRVSKKKYYFQSDIMRPYIPLDMANYDVHCCSDHAGKTGYELCPAEFRSKARVESEIYNHCWPAFNDFASISVYTANANGTPGLTLQKDEGPIVWSPTGYSNRKWGTKPGYHPTSIVGDDGYLYVFFDNPRGGGGNLNCTSVARTLLANFASGTVNTQATWKILNNGSWENSPNALPAGYQLSRFNDYLTTSGASGACLFEDESPAVLGQQYQYEVPSVVNFRVAKVRGTPYYIGAEERLHLPEISGVNQSWDLVVRFSRDLIHWSNAQSIASATALPNASPWGNGVLQTPKFYNKNATSNLEIDPCEFYVVGSQPNNGYAMHKQRFTIPQLCGARWYLKLSQEQNGPTISPFTYGAGSWTPVSGDWRGIGRSGVGMVDPKGGWYFRDTYATEGSSIPTFQYGAEGWKPVPGDWNGDGKTTVGMFDPASANWYLRDDNSPGPVSYPKFSYGGKNWIPLVGDWDGDGKDSIGVFDPNTATFYLKDTIGAGAPTVPPFAYGGKNLVPVAGDWDGDGKDSIGVFDPATRWWYLRNKNSAGPTDYSFNYGWTDWKPVVGRWNGGAKSTVGMIEPTALAK